MSKNNQIYFGKHGIETEKLSSEESTINKKDFRKSKTPEKEEVKNSSFLKQNSLDNYNSEKHHKLSNTQRILEKIENKYKKLNSEFIRGYPSFKKNIIKISTNSEQERYNIIQKKLSERNNNMNKRVKIFVPASEYLDLLEEIDAEENDDINSVINNNEIKDNSEEEKLDNFFIDKMFDETKTIKEKDNYDNTKLNTEKNYDEISSLSNFYFKHESSLNNKKNNFYREQIMLMEKRKSKYLKDYDEIYSIFITEVWFKNGKYEANIKKYKKCLLLLKPNFLFVLNQSSFIEQKNVEKTSNQKNLLINLEKKLNTTFLQRRYNLSYPLLSLNFNLLSCILLINRNKSSKEFQIRILGTDKIFSFILNNEKEFNKYIYLLRDIINNSEGFKKNKLGLSLRNKIFFKEIYISLLDFESNAKTGDLLLFKGFDSCANMQRLYTCDNYDHVAIIIKENSKIKIFESTSMGKCSPLSWIHFKMLYFNLVYEKIAFRELIYENKNEEKIIEEKSKKFLKEIEGKNYYLSISRFLCCQKPDDYEYEKKFEESKGFCCSALVAALYIKIGVAKLQKSVHSVKPGDFEQRRNRIYFEKGYSLGPEKILEFSE